MQVNPFFSPPLLGQAAYRFLTALAVLLLFACSMPLAYGQGTDLVVNGSFEADPVPPYPGYSGFITGWTLGGGDVINNASGPFYQPANGPIPDGSLVYGKQGTGTTSQLITGLSNGANCTLKFYRNLRVTAPMKLTVLMGSHVLWGPTRILTTNPFVEETVTFTYNSAWGNVLHFSFTEAEGDATILLDHVRLFVSYTVTPSVTGGNGTIAPNTAQTVNAGNNIAFSMTPTSGYRLSQVLIDGTRIDDLSTTYTFTNVYANHTIAASFALPDWTFDTAGYREGWSPMSQIDSWDVTGGLLRYDITTTATDPMWASQRLTLPRAGYRWLRVIAKNETKCIGSILFWDDNTIGGFTGGYQHNYPINPHDTQLSEYWVDLNAKAQWMAATTIEQFRFDFPDSAPTSPLGNDGTHVDVDRITLLPDGSGPPPPQVTSIIRHDPTTAPPNYTNAAQVTWEVRFNHTMTTVAANDFGFTATGTASGAVASVTRIGPTWYRVTADVSGTGTLRLDGVTGGSGRDVANQAISTGYTSGELYNIDREGPAVSIGAPSTTLTKSGPLTYEISYTDAGSGFSASTLAPANITLNATGTAAGTIGVSGSGATRTVTISGITGTGTLGISLAAGTATDILGNTSPAAGPSATCVVDNTPPTPSCKNITVNLSAPDIGPTDIDNGSSDNVAIASLTINGGAGVTYGCADLGNNIATLGVTDTVGNYAECDATVTVVDDINPSAVCQNITVNLSAPTVAAAAIDNGSDDNCGIASMLIDGAPDKIFTCADMPSTTVTLRVEDAAGNFDECPATVTVVDDVNPVAACKNITVPLSAATIGPDAIDGGSMDECGIASMWIDGAANREFTCADIATNPNTVTLRVEDAAGNSAECPATVTVVDDINPVATCQNITVNLSEPTIDASAIDGGSTDNCGIASMLIDGAPSKEFTCADMPSTTVILRVEDAAGNSAECPATVTVVDDIDPVATCQNVTVNLSAPTIDASAIDGGSTDNCGVDSLLIDGAATREFTCADMPSVSVPLTVTDAAGNSNTCNATVTVVDDVAPTAACQDITVYLSAPTITGDALDNGSDDNCAITTRLIDGVASREFTCTDIASNPNPVTLRVEDAAGNSAECPATVTVVDDIAPVARCKDITVALNPSSITVYAADIDNVSTDNCGIATVRIDGAAEKTFSCADLGDNTVTLTVTDDEGNSTDCEATITVEDADAPVAICQSGLTVGLGAPLEPAVIDGGSTDNCGIETRLINGFPNLSFNCGSIGENNVTLRVIDASGKSAVCTTTVTVVDDVPPVPICEETMTVYLSDAFRFAYSFDNGSMDNCSIVFFEIDGENNRVFTCDDIPSTTVTVTVTDGSDNETSCETVVTVIDDMEPMAVCQDVTVNLSSPTLAASALDNGSLDECGITTMLIDGAAEKTFTCADLGATTVTLRVEDAAGNSAECDATVTVVDDVAPIAICQNITVPLSAPTIGPDAIDGGSSDNCGITAMLINGGASVTYDAGDVGVPQTAVLRVEDAAGLFAECTAEITVIDETAEGEGEPEGLHVTADQTHFIVPEGASVTFEILVSGAEGALTYQWYRLTPDKAYTSIPDATDAVYTLDDITVDDVGEYQCEVYDDVLAETAWSPVFTLEIGTGVPVAGMAGLAAALALAGLGSALVMRRRRQ